MEQSVLYKYSRMSLEQFAMFEENLTNDIKEVEYQTESQFSYSKDESEICCKIIVNIYNQDKPLAKSELRSYYKIKPESIDVLKNGNDIAFNPALLVQFASLCYGSMRGVLFAKTMNTPLNHFVLPPVYFNRIIDKAFVVKG
jgi:hypothetical protein